MDARPDDRRRFWGGLALVAAAAVAVRALYVLTVVDRTEPGLDAVWYLLQAGAIREGRGYVSPASLFADEVLPSAAFPPAYPTVLAGWQLLVGDGVTAGRALGVVLGTLTVVLTALVGRRLVGARAGLVAAAVVALDPLLVASDGAGMSEALSVPLVTLATLLALRLVDRGATAAPAIGLGAVCGLAALTRQDLLAAAPLFALVVVVGARSPGDRPALGRRCALGGLVVVAAAALVVPWALRNEATVGSFTVATISGPSAMAGANCDATYSGRSLGSWEFSCVVAAQRLDLPEGEQARILQRAGSSYARAHTGRLPLVVAARQARVWGFWERDDQVRREAEESRHVRWQEGAWLTNPVLVVAGAAGLVLAARRDVRRALPLVVAPALVVLSATASYGNPRFSAIAHPVLAVGVAVVVDALAVRFAQRRRG